MQKVVHFFCLSIETKSQIGNVKMSSDKGKNEASAELLLQAALVLHSTDLFGEKKLVLIRHNDYWYKLMVTKQNKLILMK